MKCWGGELWEHGWITSKGRSLMEIWAWLVSPAVTLFPVTGAGGAPAVVVI